MHAVYPRARVRLSAVAVALSLSSTFALTFPATSAHAETASSALTSNDAVNTPVPPALPTLSLLAAPAVQAPLTAPAPAKKPVQISRRLLAHEKAIARKAAAHRATLRKAAARRAAAKKAALHKAKLARAIRAASVRRAAFGKRVIRAAARYRGTPYRYGAAGPSRFDCSGFTRFVFAKFGIYLPHSSSGQYSVVRHIASSQKRIGDLVFFHSRGGHVYHVGIYAGGDEIWAATHTGDFVRLEGMWNASYYVGRIA